MAKVKGKWILNPTVDVSDLYRTNTYEFSCYCNFTSNNQSCRSLNIEWDTSIVGFDKGITVLRYYVRIPGGSVSKTVGWSDTVDTNTVLVKSEYRTIDFGETEQTVQDKFYSWLQENATQIIIGEDDKTYTVKGQTLRTIADTMRAKTGKTNPIAVEDFYNSIAEVYNAGKQAEYDEFWDMVQESGKRTSYVYAFSRWGSEYIRPKHKVVLTDKGSQKMIFYLNGYIKKIEADYFDFSQLPRGTNDNQSFSYTFTANSKLEEIEDIGLPISYSYEFAFAWCTELRKIEKITVDANTILSNAFTSCLKLEDITFEGEIGNDINFKWSTKLTKTSIESIINHLSDTTTGKTLTLSITAVKNAFGGETWDSDGDGKADIVMDSEEWVDLQNTKPNWTISLV